MKTFPIILTVTLLATPALRAQLVADGATNTLSNVTNNIPGSVIVGTNGSFTLLVLSDNALVTNSAHFVIGANATARSNEVQLISPTARWLMGGATGFRFLIVGSNGASSRLVVSNGALMANNADGYVGFGANTSNNVALVTGTGSVWSASGQVSVGQTGVGNLLTISNGGQVLCNDGRVGSVGSNNQAVVTGAGSQWTNQTDFYVGVGGGGNRLLLENGGRLADGLGYIGANATSRSNEVVVTGNGSIWSNRLDLQIGQNGAFNRLVISNGGWVVNTNSTAGVNAIATNNQVVVTGNGSVWSNRGDVTLGFAGSGNQLTVSNGATVVSSNGFLGFNTSSSSNRVAVTGPGSYWSNVNRLHVGESGSGNFLIVSNGALVGSTDASLGETAASGNNLAVVSGTNSAWTNRYNFRVGSFGSGNRLVVEDGGLVANEDSGFVGAIGSRNEAVVTGPGSRWNNNPELYVGYQGTNNQLTVSNSAVVRDDIGYVGHDIFSSNNVALVTGSSSVWSNADALYIGRFGSRNRLVVTNGGLVFAGSNVFVGESVTTGSNRVVVDGGALLASNSSGTARLDVRRGTNILNAGLIDIDQLLLTNTQGFFEFKGGTLITRGAFITNLTPFVVGISGGTPAVWDVRAGTSHSLTVPVSLGQHSSFNQLLVTNGALLASAGGFIGLDANAKSNTAVVAGPGSAWANSAVLQIGSSGSFNSLVVSNGGAVSNNIGYLGLGGNNCLALVTGAGSLWTNAAELDVGSGGASNQLVISDGGVVKSPFTFVGLTSSDSDNLALVTGTNALWSTAGDLFFGRSGPRNRLVVSNGGWLACGVLHLGLDATSSSNVAVVTGAGSVLTNAALNVGRAGPGNQLIVSNGGEVRGGTTTVGFDPFGTNDLALVTDPGSALKGDLNLGFSGAFAGLVVSNGAAAYGNYGISGFNTSGSNSLALLTGAGSVWSNALELTVGLNSRRNQVVVSNGAALFAGNALYVGFNASSTDNRIFVDGGTLRVTNLTGTGVLDIRRGTNVLNAGLIEADIVRMTNGPASRLEFNGGTLSAKSSRIASGTIFRIGNGVSPATMLLAGNGVHDFGGNLVVTVSSNAVLTGNGTLLGGFTISSGGQLIPGTSVGRLVFSNSPALQGAVIMEISKNGAALTNDQVQVTGTLNYGGSLLVSNLGPTALAVGDNFKLFAATSYGGAFSSIILPPLGSGLSWTNKLAVDGSIEVTGAPVRDLGVDVSHFQGESGISATSWNQMLSEGKRFAFVKATEGLSVLDGAMANNMLRATAAGLRAGVYHFAHPELRPTTIGAAQEADYLLDYAGNFIGPGYLRPVLDLETGSTLTTTELTDWVIAFANEIITNRGPGAAPIVYCFQSYANNELDSRLAGYDLWLRTITGIDPSTNEPPSQGFTDPTGVFDNWSFWQYSSTGNSGGISPLDLNVCHSEFKSLDSYLIPAMTNPVAPEIITQPQDRTVTVSNNASFTVTVSVSSSTPLSYQWRFDGTNINGATARSLIVTNAQFTNAGSYTVVITNAAGGKTSEVATLTVTPPQPPFQGVMLYEENFDSYSSPGVVTTPDTTNGFKIFFGAASGGYDFTAAFGVDYSGVTSPTTIPPAPHSTNGTTKGLFLTVNKDATGAAAAVNLYPVSQTFTGSVALKCDVWINFPNTGTATEHALFGINHSGQVTNRVGQATSDGLFLAMSSDGQVSSGSTTLRDFALFSGGGDSAIPVLLTTANTVFGPEPLLGANFDNADAGFAALFPPKTLPTFTTLAGAAGNGWVSVEVRQQTNLVTWLLNNVIIAQFTNTSAFTSGDLLIGYNDAFASIGGIDNFAIFDNLRVETAVPDYDNDGLLDQWEIQFFGSLSADPNADADGDGLSNNHEFLAGTNPTNAASVFKVVGAARTTSDIAVTWTAVGGHSYVVQRATNATGSFLDLSPVLSELGTGESIKTYTDIGGATNNAAFYRVRLGP